MSDSPPNSDDQFCYNMYNKLWESINAREMRVWTFMSFYGVAVGLAFSSSAFRDYGAGVAFAIQALSMWALALVINADWWSHRNRMMVGRLEMKYPKAVRGIVPQVYQTPKFSVDQLHRVSLTVLPFLAFLVLVRATYPFAKPNGIDSWWISVEVFGLYAFFIFVVIRTMESIETNICNYFKYWKSLDEGSDSPATPEVLAAAEIKARKEAGTRWGAIIWIVLALGALDLNVFSVFPARWDWSFGRLFVIAIVIQIVNVVAIAFAGWQYFNPSAAGFDGSQPIGGLHRHSYRIVFQFVLPLISFVPLAGALWMAGSIGTPVSGSAAANLTSEANSLGLQVQKLHTEVEAAKSAILNEQLKAYLKRADADATYLHQQQRDAIVKGLVTDSAFSAELAMLREELHKKADLDSAKIRVELNSFVKELEQKIQQLDAKPIAPGPQGSKIK